MSNATIIKKISPKAICGRIAKPEGKKAIARIFGIAHGTVTGTTQYGDFTGFKGTFGAINLDTGEEFASAKCFLPDVATDMIAAALADEANETIQFAYDVMIDPADTEQGYVFSVKPVIEATHADPLAALKGEMAPLPALAAPAEKVTDIAGAKAKK